MFEESVRNKRSFHDYDKDENRLAEIIQANVTPDVIASATQSVQAYEVLSRQMEQEKATYHRRDEDGLTKVCEKYRPERQRLARQVEEATEGIYQELLTDSEASTLLRGFSRNSRTQLSAIRDALHLIMDASVKAVHINRDETVEEMAGAA